MRCHQHKFSPAINQQAKQATSNPHNVPYLLKAHNNSVSFTMELFPAILSLTLTIAIPPGCRGHEPLDVVLSSTLGLNLMDCSRRLCADTLQIGHSSCHLLCLLSVCLLHFLPYTSIIPNGCKSVLQEKQHQGNIAHDWGHVTNEPLALTECSH